MTEKTNGAAKRKKEPLKKIAHKAEKKRASKQKQPQHSVSVEKLKLLITVVDKVKADYYADLLQSFDVNLQVMSLGRGTANAKMLGYLGLTDVEKTVIFSVIREGKLSEALSALDEKFKSIKGGKGIAFTIPLTSVIGTLIYGFLSNNKMVVKENK